MRFKKGSFRFWGCLPIYSASAARAAGLSDANIRRRILEVHHEAMGVLVEGHIRPLAVPRVIQFADKEWRSSVVRLAFLMGDHPAQMKHQGHLTRGCATCWADEDDLDCTDQIWPLRDSAELLASMRRIAHECLNDAGEVLRGKLKVIRQWEEESRIRFGYNSILEMVEDLDCQVTLFTPRDFLHAIILGLFGVHIVRAILYLIQSTIFRPEFTTPHGGRDAPVKERDPGMKRLLRRFAVILGAIHANESCLTITPEFAEHFLKVYVEGRSSFTGPRMNNLMLTLPYALRDIAGPERAAINEAIRTALPGDPLHGMQMVEDPSVKIVETLIVFMDWYLLIRRRELSSLDIVELMDRGQAMMESLKTTFPEKSGEAKTWKFGKFHDVVHLPLNIIIWGWIETTSGQSGEKGHVDLLKALAGCINVNDYFETLLRFWERHEHLARVRRQEGIVDSGDDSDGSFEGHRESASAARSEDTMYACELGVRAPLLFMAMHREDLHHRAASCSKDHRKGRQAFSVWTLARGAKQRSKVRMLTWTLSQSRVKTNQVLMNIAAGGFGTPNLGKAP